MKAVIQHDLFYAPARATLSHLVRADGLVKMLSKGDVVEIVSDIPKLSGEFACCWKDVSGELQGDYLLPDDFKLEKVI